MRHTSVTYKNIETRALHRDLSCLDIAATGVLSRLLRDDDAADHDLCVNLFKTEWSKRSTSQRTEHCAVSSPTDVRVLHT